MEQDYHIDSSNINSLWLENINENLKNLENMERIAREGCESIMDYVSMSPQLRNRLSADIQYKNLKFMITEINLLLTDLTPVIEKKRLINFIDVINKLNEITKDKKMFVKERYSVSKSDIISSQTTEIFNETIEYITQFKREIIKEIEEILFIKTDTNIKSKFRGVSK